MRLTRIPVIALVGVLAGSLAGCGWLITEPTTPLPSPTSVTAPDPSLARFYEQGVTWTDCGDAECAKVLVPLDYDDPDGDTVELAVSRVKAFGDRIGSLFVNPGGPGGSGFDYAKAADAIVSFPILEAYDVVGIDPRGVGKSDPVECLTDAERDALLAIDGTPDSPAEEQTIIEETQGIAAKCESRGGPLLTHMGTVNAARDMDIVRAVVGDPLLSYLGASYGSNLGAVYAELFPDRVGRMVLDGALPASLEFVETTKGQALAFEESFADFARDCSQQDDCPFPGGPQEVATALRAFLASLDADPVTVGSRVVNESVASYAVLSYLYFPATDYPMLREALAKLVKNRDGRQLLQILDERQSRSPDGEYLDNSSDAFYGVTCADTTDTVTVDQVRAYAQEWKAIAPTFGPSLAWGLLACNDWPAPAVEPLRRTTAAGSAPILVVSTTHDPATPYQWGVRLAEELENGRLISWDAYNHTAYRSGSECIDSAIDDYLLRGTVPAEGTICQ